MEELEDDDKESMLMNMLIKTAVHSIIQNKIIYFKQSDQRSPKVDFPEYAEFT